MEPLLEALDIFTYGAALLGGLLAVLWIYNSTIKERRNLLRRTRKFRDPALDRLVNQGAFLQRLGFSAAAAATGCGILWFAREYYHKYHVPVARPYVLVAVGLIALGLGGVALAFIFRAKE